MYAEGIRAKSQWVADDDAPPAWSYCVRRQKDRKQKRWPSKELLDLKSDGGNDVGSKELRLSLRPPARPITSNCAFG